MKLHTTRRGNGPLLVCHPGGPGFDGSELLDLGGLDATRTLLLVDPRGTGGSAEAETYLLDDYVADVEELRVDLGEEQIDLLGFSHGGLVAAAYAIAHPGRIRKLVLTRRPRGVHARDGGRGKAGDRRASRTSRGMPPPPPRSRARSLATTGRRSRRREMWNAMVPLYFSRWEERYRPLVEVRTHEPRAASPVQRRPFDLRPELGGIEAETLVITGRDDFICGPAAAQVLADGIPRSELVIVENAGHMLHLEQPAAYSAAVEAFLAR